MGKSLVIVESPAKAKTIKKFLGSKFEVLASMGHVRDLPKKRLGIDVENDFKPDYINIRGKGKALLALKKSADKADAVYLAPDPDREGEAIAWHLKNYLSRPDSTNIHRVSFNEITEHAVKNSIQAAGEIDMRKVDAQQARRILDRLVGYMVSPLLWKVVYRGTSAGRVQSVALRLIVEREDEINAFKTEEYWTISGEFVGKSATPFLARLVEVKGEKPKIGTDAEAQAILGALKGVDFVVREVIRKARTRNPGPPFITSTLQQDAARRLGYSARKTMSVAQDLYEGVETGEGPVGLITYMRTDSTRISNEALDEVRKFIGEKYGEASLPKQARGYKAKKGAQDAHEGIRPTSAFRTPESLRAHLSSDQFRLYELIWNRFVASQMEQAQFDTTTVSIDAGEYAFRASGSILKFAGFLQVYGDLVDPKAGGEKGMEELVLPPIDEGERLACNALTPEQHFTQPPPRYNEASLVKTLEEKGIGRPSTYAAIIATLISRKYVTREKSRFFPTEIGIVVGKFLIERFDNIFNVGFTAKMEEELDRIESGEDEWVKVVRNFYDPFKKELDEVTKKTGEIRKEMEKDSGETCEKCGKAMIVRWGRNGQFLACSGYPDCKSTKPLGGEEPKATGESCEKCGGAMVVRSGRFGRFVACSNYPDCKNTKPLSVGVSCPEPNCGGYITEKRSKKGRTFYGCSRYPDCTFALWNKPVAEKCAECNSPYMLEKWAKAKGSYLECPSCKNQKVLVEA
ncbi:MAG: type I DNA topoisomerase [bacterium]